MWLLKRRVEGVEDHMSAVRALMAGSALVAPAAPPESTPTPAVAAPSISGIPQWLTEVIARHAPADLADNADFYRVVAAGAKAESGWNPRSVQPGGGGRGLWQFDIFGGMGTGIPESQLFDPDFQAARIVPVYAQYYRQRPANGSSATASWIAGMAERPYDYTNPNSSARRSYAAAFEGIR